MTGMLRKMSRDFRNATGLRKGKGPKSEREVVPGPPTLDVAAQNTSDRIGRRRSALMNIFGGGTDNPAVAKRTLGG